MQHSTVYHYSSIVKISHKATSFKVENFKSAVFTGGVKPFVVLLKSKCCDVPRMTLERYLRQGWHVWIHTYFIYFYNLMSSDSDVLSIISDCKLIYVRVRIGDLRCRHTCIYIPKLYRVIISRSRKNQLLLLLSHIFILNYF
jgi:hypothetical protein